MNEFINRIRTEQKEYLDHIATLSPKEIIRKAYEICWREEIICVLENTEFDNETLELLNKIPYVLDVLYYEWLGTDVSVHDMLADVVHEFVNKEMSK